MVTIIFLCPSPKSSVSTLELTNYNDHFLTPPFGASVSFSIKWEQWHLPASHPKLLWRSNEIKRAEFLHQGVAETIQMEGTSDPWTQTGWSRSHLSIAGVHQIVLIDPKSGLCWDKTNWSREPLRIFELSKSYLSFKSQLRCHRPERLSLDPYPAPSPQFRCACCLFGTHRNSFQIFLCCERHFPCSLTL